MIDFLTSPASTFDPNSTKRWSEIAVRRRLYPTADAAYQKLVVEFGCEVHHWPSIPAHAPHWWQRAKIANERKINHALATIGRGPITRWMREAYWLNVHFGQDVYEDAGGYMWRCWCAAIGLPHRPASQNYTGFAADFVMVDEHGLAGGA